MRNATKIFIIPSWYPTQEQPNFGIFIKEQHYLVANNSNYIQFISYWGNANGNIQLNNFSNLFKILIYKFLKKQKIEEVKNNLYILYRPIIYWSSKLPFGYQYMIRKSTEKNFLHVQKKFGKINLIHAHVGYPAGYVAQYLSNKYKVPYIITEHMSPFPFKNLIVKGRLKTELYNAYLNAKEIIAVSPALKEEIVKYGFKNISVIPNFIDEDIFCPIANRVRNKNFKFFTLCGITEQKGIDILLLAIKIWSPMENVEFIIAGNGPLLNYYKKLAISLDISSKIKWVGSLNRKEVIKTFKKVDCFVLPSNHETFGIVYIEAIAFGIPIIATKCGGPEYIVNDINGFLIEKKNPNQLAVALKKVFNNYYLFNEINIRKDFLQNFSKKNVIPKILSTYNKNI